MMEHAHENNYSICLETKRRFNLLYHMIHGGACS